MKRVKSALNGTEEQNKNIIKTLMDEYVNDSEPFSPSKTARACSQELINKVQEFFEHHRIQQITLRSIKDNRGRS